MPRTNQQLARYLTQAQTTLDNALTNPALLEQLAGYGYDQAKLRAGRELAERVQQLSQEQQRTYGDQLAASDAFASALKQATALSKEHLTIARVALKQDRGAWQRLGLEGRRLTSTSGWLAQARQFYDNALAEPALLPALAAFGLDETKLRAGQDAVAAVEAALPGQQRERGEAQEATRARDAAFDALEDWMRDFRTIARVALAKHLNSSSSLGCACGARDASAAASRRWLPHLHHHHSRRLKLQTTPSTPRMTATTLARSRLER